MRNETTKIYLSYRIRGKSKNLSLKWLMEQIGVEPSWTFQAGEPYSSRRPDGSGGWTEVISVRPFTVWGITTKNAVESSDLKPHTDYLIASLEPSRATIEALVSKSDLYDIGLLLRINSTEETFTDSIGSNPLTNLMSMCHRFDLSFLCTSTLINEDSG